MSMLFVNGDDLVRTRHPVSTADHQQNSWLARLGRWLACREQRADLRAIADDPHLLSDLGLTREEVLKQANMPFWR